MDSALLVADKGLLFFSGALKVIAASYTCTWKTPYFHGITHSFSHSLHKDATNRKPGDIFGLK